MDPTTSGPESGHDADLDPQPDLVADYDGVIRYVYSVAERPCRVKVEHDRDKRLFRILGPDGKTRVFRDEPLRFLVVARNPQTGETTPMLRYGEPEYLDLCREERERQ
jgi:hypothetical protein